MQRPVLAFAPGQPYEVALKYPTGKAVSNGRIMFSTVDGEVFFVDEFDADAIYALELRPQEKFRIMKRNGQILVERARVEQPAPQAPAAPAVSAIDGVPVQTPQPNGSTPLSKLMASAYISAVDALTIAKQYADAHGVPFKISTMELRSCAHSIFIAATKQGVR